METDGILGLNNKQFWLFACLLAIIIAALAVIGYGIYLYRGLDDKLAETEGALASTTGALEESRKENEELNDDLRAEKERNDSFESQIREISDTVTIIDKIQKLDPQLLQKYSKIYFLNENYVPAGLTDIDEEYLYNQKDKEQILTNVWPKLEKLLKKAAAAGQELRIISAYRSFSQQETLKSQYTVTYGSGANKFSADQGYSEHQLGTTVDFTTPALGAEYTSFDQDPAYQWLLDNAYKYGFVQSYPRNNAYYQFEPWHWRYVGVDLATYLHDRHLNFYDLSQRKLSTYLAKIFD